ncbi:hypothetical protein GBN32_01325, partial [Plesiomonas shigelloides]|uniref:PcfJ domain-containing protein n=1 Tax=Plesiomonas shigelloides TaxID=703 RepID=UPI0013C9049A
KKRIKIDNTNKSIHHACEQYFRFIRFSIGDIKAFRKIKPTLIYIIAQLLNDTTITLKRYSYGAALEETILAQRDTINLAKKFLRLDILNKYPTTVICDIFEYIFIKKMSYYIRRDIKNIFLIIEKWLEYHKDLYKNIGYNNSKHRWQQERNNLYHVIDWYKYNRDTLEINKKYKWPTMWQNAHEWGLNPIKDVDCNIPEEWIGTRIDWALIMPDVIEITNKEDLFNEGLEMSHCVYSYLPECANGLYVVFSLRSGKERATLGCYNDTNDKRYKLEQVRGFDNAPVSKAMEKKAKDVVLMLNQLTYSRDES